VTTSTLCSLKVLTISRRALLPPWRNTPRTSCPPEECVLLALVQPAEALLRHQHRLVHEPERVFSRRREAFHLLVDAERTKLPELRVGRIGDPGLQRVVDLVRRYRDDGAPRTATSRRKSARRSALSGLDVAGGADQAFSMRDGAGEPGIESTMTPRLVDLGLDLFMNSNCSRRGALVAAHQPGISVAPRRATLPPAA